MQCHAMPLVQAVTTEVAQPRTKFLQIALRVDNFYDSNLGDAFFVNWTPLDLSILDLYKQFKDVVMSDVQVRGALQALQEAVGSHQRCWAL